MLRFLLILALIPFAIFGIVFLLATIGLIAAL
jgi:hypothetical protein